jgi:hypothetical protein
MTSRVGPAHDICNVVVLSKEYLLVPDEFGESALWRDQESNGRRSQPL